MPVETDAVLQVLILLQTLVLMLLLFAVADNPLNPKPLSEQYHI